MHFAQQPGALLPNRKHIQIGLSKLYNLILGVFLDVYHQLPFLATMLLAPKGNFTVFPIPGSEFDHFGCSNWPGVMFNTIKNELTHS